MTRLWILPLLLTLASPLRAETPSVAAALESVDRAVAADMAAHAVPGLEIAIVQDRSLLWSRSYGLADLASSAKVTDSTRFGIGSISKLFTALAIVQLCDAGRLNLDDAVTKSLPWFRLAGERRPTWNYEGNHLNLVSQYAVFVLCNQVFNREKQPSQP